MRKTIRLVASDMDGTLLNPAGMVSERTVDTIQKLRSKNCEFIVCTGRSWNDARIPLEAKNLRCDAICMNGAAVYDKTGQLLFSRELSKEQIQKVLESCEGKVVFDFMTDKGSCTISSREQFREFFYKGILLPMAGAVRVESVESRFSFVSLEELFSGDYRFYKMSVISEDEEALDRIRKRLNQIGTLAVAASERTNLEITDSGAQKGLALLMYAQMRGIRPGEILAVGDSENDRSMLALPLGFSLAMENGMEAAKQTARCQTRSNEKDGVAYAIESLILAL